MHLYIYASVNWIIIALVNVFVPDRRDALLNQTNVGLISMELLLTNFS